ncbi:MAG: hypothetical protein JSS44_07975 [Proteobacteria bacterium]|nr:hypothetical protein [Pseudomonadota bacterium]MBS0462041.1 hypothetical protein [Pseudomonadota bacterium]MBS0465310.1 hypothetical protein [Pseudomonadota bacterium]
MKIPLLLLSGWALMLPASAALPPQYQNAKDLDVMVGYLKAHEAVMATFTSIDLQHFVIHFGADCQIVFGRAYKPKPAGWVGPADPLEFKRSTCRVDADLGTG